MKYQVLLALFLAVGSATGFGIRSTESSTEVSSEEQGRTPVPEELVEKLRLVVRHATRELGPPSEGCPEWDPCYKIASARCTQKANEKNWNNADQRKANWISKCIPNNLDKCMKRRQNRTRRDTGATGFINMVSNSAYDKMTAMKQRLLRREAVVEMLSADNLIDQLESIHDTLETLTGKDLRPLTMEDVRNIRLFANSVNGVDKAITEIQNSLTERVSSAANEVTGEIARQVADQLSAVIAKAQKVTGMSRVRRQLTEAPFSFISELQNEISDIVTGSIDAASTAALEPFKKHVDSMRDTLNKFVEAGTNSIPASPVDLKNLEMIDGYIVKAKSSIEQAVSAINGAAGGVLTTTGSIDNALKQIAAANLVDVSSLQKKLDFSDVEKQTIKLLNAGNSVLQAASTKLEELRSGSVIELNAEDLANLGNIRDRAESAITGLTNHLPFTGGRSRRSIGQAGDIVDVLNRVRKSAQETAAELGKVTAEAGDNLITSASNLVGAVSRFRRNPEQMGELVNLATGLAATGGLNAETIQSLAEHYIKRDLLNLSEDDVIANLTADLDAEESEQEDENDREDRSGSSESDERENARKALQRKIQPGILNCVQTNKGDKLGNLTECNTKVVEDQCPSRQQQ